MEFTVPEELSFRKIEGSVFIVDAGRSLMHELKGPAADIWEGLASGLPAGEIVGNVVSVYDIDEGRAGKDFDAFVRELFDAGLLRRS